MAIQNCNSLNLAGITMNYDTKITAITSVRTDLIFLSDVRIVNSQGIRNDERVFNYFRDSKECSYYAILHSSMNARGVGILISHKLDFALIAEERDLDENYLAVKVEIAGTVYILVSIYGPNNPDRHFFSNLKNSVCKLKGNAEAKIVMGGDWNCTWDKY